MSNQHGIKNLKLAAFFGAAFGMSLAESRGKSTTFGKAAAFLSCLDEAAGLLKVDKDELLKEWKDLDAAERAQLCQAIKEKFELPDDLLEAKVEETIERAMVISGEVDGLVKLWG